MHVCVIIIIVIVIIIITIIITIIVIIIQNTFGGVALKMMEGYLRVISNNQQMTILIGW